MRVSLPVLDARIEARAQATREAHPFWPCAEGCDLCCRSLPHLPVISFAEWARLRAALGALPDGLRAATVERTRASAEASAPVTCPLLDVERGSCLVYDARPIACRTYGFYTERDASLCCGRVLHAISEHGAEDTVVWGNGEAVARELGALGEPQSLASWMQTLEERPET